MLATRSRITMLALCAAAATLACNRDADDRDLVGDTTISRADTSVVQRTVEDTLIVRRDTTITTDTLLRRGGVTDTNRVRRP